MRQLLPFKLQVILAAVSVALVICRPVDGADKGWQFEQRSQILGNSVVSISAAGAKLDYPDQGYALVAKAPRWGATLFSDENKVRFETDLQSFASTAVGFHKFFNLDIDRSAWVKVGPSTINGIKTTHYIYHGKAGKDVHVANCWMSDDIVLPAAVAEFYRRTNFLPLGNDHLAVRMILINGVSGMPVMLLETKTAKPALIPASLYGCPQAYAKARDAMSVIMGDTAHDVLDDMTYSLGPRDQAKPKH